MGCQGDVGPFEAPVGSYCCDGWHIVVFFYLKPGKHYHFAVYKQHQSVFPGMGTTAETELHVSNDFPTVAGSDRRMVCRSNDAVFFNDEIANAKTVSRI